MKGLPFGATKNGALEHLISPRVCYTVQLFQFKGVDWSI